MKLTLVVLTIFILISGCGDDGINKGVVQQISGPYTAILPCADCDGINYELNLNDDMTYTERMVYLGKPLKPISISGRWTMEGINKVILYKKTADMSKFEFSNNSLIILDSLGKRIEGPMADKYVLLAGGLQFAPELHSDTSVKVSNSDSLSEPNEKLTDSTGSQEKVSDISPSLNGKWNLKEINGMKPEEGNYMTGIPDLEIRESDNKFTCNTGCNRVNGGVQIKGNLISFSKFLGTKMTCPGMGEKEYISTMTAVDSYTLENGVLNLKAAGKTVLKYSR